MVIVNATNPFPRIKGFSDTPFKKGTYIRIVVPGCADGYYGPIPKHHDLQTALEVAEEYCRQVTLPYEPEATFEMYFQK